MHEVGSLRPRMSLMVCLCTRSSTSNIITTTCTYYHPSSSSSFVSMAQSWNCCTGKLYMLV